MKDFHPKADGTYEPANWIWTTEEYDGVIKLLSNVKTPFGYGSSFQHKFNDRKIVGFKTHDYHNLLHDLFPIAVRGTLTEDIRKIIYKISSLFKWLCSKEIAKKDIWQKKIEAAELLCEIEMCLPLSLLDIQFHNIVHLVEEVELCGPVSVRWMYFQERYLKHLKDFVRQRSRPEGSMAEGYICAEAMFYVNEYSLRLHKNAFNSESLVKKMQS